MILENSRETSSLSIILKSYLDYNNCTSIWWIIELLADN
jgi:hypothetical protein